MAKTRSSQAKSIGKSKASIATTRSTAGPGFAFEDQVGALLLLKMLLGEPLPGLGATGSKLQTQIQALNWSIDDILAICQPGLEAQRQLAVSCKSSVQVTASGLPKDFVLPAWEQWAKCAPNPFNRSSDLMMLATRGRNDNFQALWADLKNWCSGGDPVLALARISQTAKHRRVFESIKAPVQGLDPTVSDAQLVAFINRLAVFPTDFDLGTSDRDQAIAQCRTLLVSGQLQDAIDLWSALVEAVRDARLGHGTIDLSSLWQRLLVKFPLRDHPDYGPSWAALRNIAASYTAGIETVLSTGHSIARPDEIDALAAAIEQPGAVVLFGESGTGKSALLISTLAARFSSWSQVWVGPDELRMLLNRVERPKLGLAHPLDEALLWATTSQNVLIIDAAERLAPDVRKMTRALVGALLQHNAAQGSRVWQVVIVGQTEAWRSGDLQLIANATLPANHEVKPLSPAQVMQALRTSERLRWIIAHDDLIQILTNLRALAWVMEAEGQFDDGDASALTSLPAIAERLWLNWTADNIALQGLVMRLAEREANFEHSFAISEFDPADAIVFQARPQALPLRITGRKRVEFQHDLAADWARFQRLKELSDQTERWAAHAINPLWTGALRMLGGFLLRERSGGRPSWDIAFEAVAALPDKAAAADVLLDALCLDPLAYTFLTERAELLFRKNGELLIRLLKRFQHIATVPGGNPKLLADVLYSEPSFALYIEAQFRTPIIGRWPAVAQFLYAHKDRVASLLSPTVSALCEKWLTTMPMELSGKPTAFRREFAEVALAYDRPNHRASLGRGKTVC